MTASRPFRFTWLAPLLVGFTAAVAAEVAVAVLLYTGPGLVRSLTLILGVEAAAFGVGIWVAARPPTDVVEAVRRRWLLCLTAFLAAAGFAALWTFLDSLAGTPVGQGFGLALLAALPLYASGSVLATVALAANTDAGEPFRTPGAPAALGAALGFGATGFALPQAASPSSLLLGCIVVLSLGGLVQGAALARRTQVKVVAVREEESGPVRVEDRYVASTGTAVRVLFEGPHVRRSLPLQSRGTEPWEVALMRAAVRSADAPWRILVLGGGASALPQAALREHPTVTVDVLEHSAAVVELGREHLDTGLSVGENGRASVRVGNLDDLILGLEGEYDLILLDRKALVPLGGATALSRRARDAATSRLSRDGVFAWGALPGRGAPVERLEGWSYRVCERRCEPIDASGVVGNGSEVVLLGGAEGALPECLEGFRSADPVPL